MKSHRHRATVIQVDDKGAAVQFTSGRIEYVVKRGEGPAWTVGQKGTVDFVRCLQGWEWQFYPSSILR